MIERVESISVLFIGVGLCFVLGALYSDDFYLVAVGAFLVGFGAARTSSGGA